MVSIHPVKGKREEQTEIIAPLRFQHFISVEIFISFLLHCATWIWSVFNTVIRIEYRPLPSSGSLVSNRKDNILLVLVYRTSRAPHHPVEPCESRTTLYSRREMMKRGSFTLARQCRRRVIIWKYERCRHHSHDFTTALYARTNNL